MSNAKVRHRRRRRAGRSAIRELLEWAERMGPSIRQDREDERIIKRLVTEHGLDTNVARDFVRGLRSLA